MYYASILATQPDVRIRLDISFFPSGYRFPVDTARRNSKTVLPAREPTGGINGNPPPFRRL